MLDLRVDPPSSLKALRVGDHYMDADGREQVVTEVRVEESGGVTVMSTPAEGQPSE